MTDELKPCPFCGGDPTEHAIEPHTHAMTLGDFKMPDHEGSHVIECACGAGFVDDTREAAATRWNTRALTAAQPARAGEVDERRRFEAEMRCEETWGHRSLKKRPDGRYQNWQVDVMWDVWQARASLPTQPAAQATPVQDVGASADYWGDLAQQKADADARRGVSMPVSYYTSSIVGALLATQQATPEPVGEVSAESILNQWMAECGVYLVEKMGHQWASQTKQADLLYLVEKAISCNRPAPVEAEPVGEAVEIVAAGWLEAPYGEFRRNQAFHVSAPLTVGWSIPLYASAFANTRPAPGVPAINYDELIRAAFAKNRKWAQGTNGCVAFAKGAEWFRDVALAAAQAKGGGNG